MPLPRPAPGTAKWWLIGGIGCLIGVALAVWLGLASTVGQVTWTDLGYRVVDDQTVTVSYDVHRPSTGAATCVVRAQNLGFATVGTVEDQIPAGGATSVHRQVTIRTTTTAVAGNVKSCAMDASSQ